MSTRQVSERATGAVVYAYTADEPVEWPGMEYATHNHLLQVPEAVPETTDADWRIYVGAFFDRFGPPKWAILADTAPTVQAVVRDASVRKFIDLDNPDLPAGLQILVAAGHPIDAAAIVEAPIQPEELP